MTTLASVSTPALNSLIRQQTERRAEQAEQQAKALENQASAKRREARQANEEAKRIDSESRQADGQANTLRANLAAADRLEQGTERNRNNLSQTMQNQTAAEVEQGDSNNRVLADNSVAFNTLFSSGLQPSTPLNQSSQSRLGQQINLFI